MPVFLLLQASGLEDGQNPIFLTSTARPFLEVHQGVLGMPGSAVELPGSCCAFVARPSGKTGLRLPQFPETPSRSLKLEAPIGR